MQDHPPIARSPELISQLMSFTPEEFAPDSDFPAEDMLKSVCEMEDWSYTGTFPYFHVNNWVEVALGSSAHVRLLNSVKHTHLNPLNYGNLRAGIAHALQQRKDFQPNPQFMQHLIKATDALKPEEAGADNTPPVYPLHKIFTQIRQQYPHLTREHFGLNLAFLMARPQYQKPRSIELEPTTTRSLNCYTLVIEGEVQKVCGLRWGTVQLNTLDI